jgi:hypothetical protein
MARSCSYRVQQLSTAHPAAVYDALMDIEHWPNFMPTVSAAVWEQRGAPDTAEGGIRCVRMGVLTVREQIVGGTRPHHQTYKMLSSSGIPAIQDYRADIRIDERTNGSLITWTGTFASRVPGLGKPLQLLIRALIARSAAALARQAEG